MCYRSVSDPCLFCCQNVPSRVTFCTCDCNFCLVVQAQEREDRHTAAGESLQRAVAEARAENAQAQWSQVKALTALEPDPLIVVSACMATKDVTSFGIQNAIVSAAPEAVDEFLSVCIFLRQELLNCTACIASEYRTGSILDIAKFWQGTCRPDNCTWQTQQFRTQIQYLEPLRYWSS